MSSAVHESNTSSAVQSRLGIAMRIALLSWLMGNAMLIFYILITLPQQKKIFMRTLESKAKSVAVALYDSTAAAAVNEDFASIVSTSQTMLEGDADIEFFYVMKNDGYALSIEQNGWRVNPKSDPFWFLEKHQSRGVIHIVPIFNRRVFHYTQPFDYSGIQWGWIHIGISLKDYDKGLLSFYKSVILIVAGCTIFSLIVSMIYARRMVWPILILQRVVKKIAAGDFSVRADKTRRDEIGSLARSVNKMADALLRRDQILQSVRFSAEQFLQSRRWEDVIGPILEKIGRAADVDRVDLFEMHTAKNGSLYPVERCQWVRPNIFVSVPETVFEGRLYNEACITSWKKKLAANNIVSGAVSQLNKDEGAFLASQGIRSIIVIPVLVNNVWWGGLGLSDCRFVRSWTEAEKDSLRAGADMLGATIARQHIQTALLEAKATLEERVQERTQELQAQVNAKEQVLVELSEAQSSLVEASRKAGMAEVATGVIHNVGNVLNSVNVSATLIVNQLRESRVINVAKVAELLTQAEEKQDGGVAEFISKDHQGKQIPAYLSSLAIALQKEQQMMIEEAELLYERIEHIKEIVSMQQNYGRISGVNEKIDPKQIMEDALKITASSLARHKIKVIRQFERLPPIYTDKHKVLQIVLNLINNAKHACNEGSNQANTIILKTHRLKPHCIQMQVIDNGIGILPENMTRIFQHSFTTRKSGHGFGLHSGAIAARELGGRLTVHSDGQGQGATFSLELPCFEGDNDEQAKR